MFGKHKRRHQSTPGGQTVVPALFRVGTLHNVPIDHLPDEEDDYYYVYRCDCGWRGDRNAVAAHAQTCAIAADDAPDNYYYSMSNELIDTMGGIEFEDYVAQRLRYAGWDVSTTPRTGDFGVDLIASKDNQRMAIQCKCYGKPVGISAIQQVVTGATHYQMQFQYGCKQPRIHQSSTAIGNDP